MAQFGEFDSPDISDQLNRLYALTSAIHCLTGTGHRVIGPACTVKVYPGDNLMVHKSLDIAKPGDVIVVDAGASRLNAALGSLISTKAQHRGVAAFIVDGYVRDLPEIVPLGFPVFARGTTPDRAPAPRTGRDQLPDLLRRRRGQPRATSSSPTGPASSSCHARTPVDILYGCRPRRKERASTSPASGRGSSPTNGSTISSTRPAASSRRRRRAVSADSVGPPASARLWPTAAAWAAIRRRRRGCDSGHEQRRTDSTKLLDRGGGRRQRLHDELGRTAGVRLRRHAPARAQQPHLARRRRDPAGRRRQAARVRPAAGRAMPVPVHVVCPAGDLATARRFLANLGNRASSSRPDGPAPAPVSRPGSERRRNWSRRWRAPGLTATRSSSKKRSAGDNLACSIWTASCSTACDVCRPSCAATGPRRSRSSSSRERRALTTARGRSDAAGVDPELRGTLRKQGYTVRSVPAGGRSCG